jgi:hypothetical protein
MRQPKKQPCHQPLSEPDKQHNQEVASDRVEIEHQVGVIKRCNAES